MTFLAAFLLISIPPSAPDVPNKQPQMAAANGIVALTYGAGKAVYFASSRDQGRTFSAPVKVGETEILPLSRHRGPRIAITSSAIVITAVGGKNLQTGPHAHGLPSDGDLLSWRSTDNGRTWSGPVSVNDAPGAAREGLHALAADKNGRVLAVWLDLRTTGTKLYSSRSDDGGATWSANVLAYASPDGTVCQCCHPSLAADAGGFVLMWRNALAGSRDMYLSRSADGRTFSAAEKIGRGTWKIDACPMDGGGVAVAGGRTVTAWRRGSDLYLAEGSHSEKIIARGKDIALAVGRSTWAAWSGTEGIEVWTSSKGTSHVVSRGGAYPSLLSLNKEALLAYEIDGAITIERITANDSVVSETSGQ
jgi:hypothetical protein